MQARMTIEEADVFIDALHARLKASAIGCLDVLVEERADTPARAILDFAAITREVVLEFEELRLAANRKPRVAKPPKVEKAEQK